MVNLPLMIDIYLNHLKVERGLAPKSIDAYARDIASFADYLDERHLAVPQIGLDAITAYLQRSADRGIGRRSQARLLSALRGFFRYMKKERHLEVNPFEDVDSPKPGRKLPVVLTLDDVERLLAAPNTATPEGLRDFTMLHTMYAAGLRVSELVSLRLADIDLEAGFLAVTGKGDKRRLVPIGDWVIEILKKYLAQVRPGNAQSGRT